MTETEQKRPPLSVRTELRKRAAAHLSHLARQGEPRPVHTPISPEFERAMISVIAQGELSPETTSWRRAYQYRQQLIGALLSHTYLSRDTIRWITLDPTHFWRSDIAQQIATHPACTIVEAVLAHRTGWADPNRPGPGTLIRERWEGEEGWENVADLWHPWGARETRAFYRFADEVFAEPPRVQEVFVRLAADTPRERPSAFLSQRDPASRRKVWEIYRIAQHI